MTSGKNKINGSENISKQEEQHLDQLIHILSVIRHTHMRILTLNSVIDSVIFFFSNGLVDELHLPSCRLAC